MNPLTPAEREEMGRERMEFELADSLDRAHSYGVGPKCPCCYRRNMQRMGYCLYRCQTKGTTYLFSLDSEQPSGYRMDALEVA